MLKKSDNAENITMPFKGSVESIRGYDEFLTSWQAFISDKGKKALKHQDQNNIEEYAANSLSRLVSDNDDFNEYAPSDLFDTLHNSAAICNAKGQVIAANKQASNDHDLMKDSMIDSLEILSENNLPLSHSINLALSKNTKAKLTLKQCHFHDSDTLFPVAIVKLDKKKPAIRQS